MSVTNSANQNAKTAEIPYQPWYKNSMVWLAFSPVIIGVMVGLTLLTIGTATFDGTVHENYYKEGRAINQSFDQDRVAFAKELKATLIFTDTEVQLELAGNLEEYPQELVLLLENPTRSSLDFQIPVKQLAKGHYLGKLEQEIKYDWDIKIFGENREWRLHGRSYFPLTQPLVILPIER